MNRCQAHDAAEAPIPSTGWIDQGAVAGNGTRIWHQAQISTGAHVGDDRTLGKGCFVGTGSTIGNRVKMGNYAGIFGAHIGDEAMIGPGALLLEDPAPRATTPDGRSKTLDDWTRRPVTIGTGVTVGAAAVIAPGIAVADHALIGVGAVVLRDVPAHALILGNPGRQVGWVCRCAHTLDSHLHCPVCTQTYEHQGDGLMERPSQGH